MAAQANTEKINEMTKEKTNTSSDEDVSAVSPTEKSKSRGALAWISHVFGDLPEYKVGGKLLSGRPLRVVLGFICSCGFLMFGYDQGVLSALLTLDSFQRDLPMMTPRQQANDLCWLDNPTNTIPDPAQCTGSPDLQALGVAIYQIGCFLGAVLIYFYGERWGRRSSTFWGSLIMIIGTVMQAASYDYGLFAAGRIVGGIGNGMVTSTLPTWQSECATAARRGFLLMIAGATIAGGVMVAYWVDYAFFFVPALPHSLGTIRWRLPVAIQSLFTIIVMVGLLFLPDSPRWLMMRGRGDEALTVTARLLGKPEDDKDVVEEFNAVRQGLENQHSLGPFKNRELLTNGPTQNLRRTILAMTSQFFQQIIGINLVTYYATFLFEQSLGFDAAMSRLLAAANGTEYFLASLFAIPIIERAGRVKLMLLGAAGMMVSMIILAVSTSTGTPLDNGAVRLSTAWGVTATVFLFVFNTFFALGWLGMTWLYPAEITSLRIRIQANALATGTNWIGNFLIVMITPPAFANLGYRTYIIFAIIAAAIIPVVFFYFPEPKGRTLEEVDIIFAEAHKEGINPVKKAKQMPKLSSAEIENRLTQLFGAEDVERRRSSIARRVPRTEAGL